MTSAATSRRPGSVAGRRAGYAVALTVNAVLLFLINVTPGWSILPFLTAGMSTVLPWINASMVAGILANAVYLLVDTPLVKSIGDLLTEAVGLVAMIRLWQVFPFDFGAEPNAWATVVRVVLIVGIVGIVGTVIAMIVSIVTAIRGRPGSVAS
jgi:hypothetical protein